MFIASLYVMHVEKQLSLLKSASFLCEVLEQNVKLWNRCTENSPELEILQEIRADSNSISEDYLHFHYVCPAGSST